jgi:hypothetical protein
VTSHPSTRSADDRAGGVLARAWTPRRFSIAVEVGLWLWIAAATVDGLLRPLLGATGLGILHGTYWGAHPLVDATLTEDAAATVTQPTVLPGYLVGGPFPRGEYVETLGLDGFTVAVGDGMSARQWFGLVGGELAGAVTVVALALFVLMVRDLRRGDLFRGANLHRLYVVAAVIGVGGTLSEVLLAWGRTAVLQADRLGGAAALDWTVSLNPLILGGALLVVAEALRQGIRMRADTEGLV